MKEIFQLNDTTSVEKKKQFKRTIITLNKNSQKKILSDLKTDEYFWSNVVFDENYVVVYSRGCMVNQIPLNIEAAYDIKEERMLDLSNKKLKVILEYMFISKRGFELTDILTFINKEDLQILDEESKGNLKRILTTDNDNITDEEVINYILSKYPIFSKYRNLRGPLSVIEYKNIEEEIGQDIFRFHLMPQSLKFIEQENQVAEKQKFNVLAVPCSIPFVVAPDKTEEFKNIKPDPIVRQQMEETAEKFRVNNLTEEDKKKDILFQDYPPLRITKETRQAVLDHPELHSGLNVRERMGKFYTDEEWEQRREDVLSTPLPSEEEKGPRLVKKRISSKNNK